MLASFVAACWYILAPRFESTSWCYHRAPGFEVRVSVGSAVFGTIFRWGIIIMATLVSHVWKPSNTRILTIDSFIPVPRGSTAITPAPLSWPAKDPGDILDYQLDIEPAIVGNKGDTINSVDIDVDPDQPGDLSVDNITADGYKIVIWLSGGQAGVTYSITVKAALASGRTLQRSMLLPVVALSIPSVPVNALETTTQDPLTDQNGNPLVSS